MRLRLLTEYPLPLTDVLPTARLPGATGYFAPLQFSAKVKNVQLPQNYVWSVRPSIAIYFC